ncbi:UNVERIFIED_CONTAM: hypothetical protein Slati_2684600 [Sesamum latifolium]|uniref:Uncharacterized protein n=1 Tax=Sesamum latifolium TaxID=2727402 RepID=A0AAW2VWF4_9LAMI
MLYTKELYPVPDWHIRYALTKEFSSARMIEGLSVREHVVIMLSLVEKLKDIQVDFEKENVCRRDLAISTSLLNQFIINYNMNELDKRLHALINMLVQYEATI